MDTLKKIRENFCVAKKPDPYAISVLAYYSFLLVFSAHFYLVDEEIELIHHILKLRETGILRLEDGYPYGGLAVYYFKLITSWFGLGILQIRLAVVPIMLLGILGTYRTLNLLVSARSATAITLLAYSFVTFPWPRIEYFLEGAMVAMALYMAVVYIKRGENRYFLISVAIITIAFFTKGFPQVALLLIIIPLGSVAARRLPSIFLNIFLRWQNLFPDTSPKLILGFCTVFAGIVFVTFYLILKSSGSIPDLNRKYFGIVFMGGIICFALTVVCNYMKWFAVELDFTISNAYFTMKRIVFLITPAIIILLWFIASGHTVDYIINLLYPKDIFSDHQGGASGLFGLVIFSISLFIVVLLSLILLKLLQVEIILTTLMFRVLLFMVFIYIAMVVRFVQLYNYLFVIIMLSAIMILFIFEAMKEKIARFPSGMFDKVRTQVVIVIVVCAITLNFLSIAARPIKHLHEGRVTRAELFPIQGIFIDKAMDEYFTKLSVELASHSTMKVAIIGRSFANYYPLLNKLADFENFNNVTIGLSRTRSFGELVSWVHNPTDNITKYRNSIALRLKQYRPDVIVIPFNLIYEPAERYYMNTSIQLPHESPNDFLVQFLIYNYQIKKYINSNLTPFYEGVVVLQHR